MEKHQKKGSLEKAVVNNYIRTLKAENPESLVDLIKKDIERNNKYNS